MSHIPSDNHVRDLELVVTNRWLPQQATWLQQQKAAILGDNLFIHQPFCELVLNYGLGFILVCKPSSHETLHEWVTTIERGQARCRIVITFYI